MAAGHAAASAGNFAIESDCCGSTGGSGGISAIAEKPGGEPPGIGQTSVGCGAGKSGLPAWDTLSANRGTNETANGEHDTGGSASVCAAIPQRQKTADRIYSTVSRTGMGMRVL